MAQGWVSGVWRQHGGEASPVDPLSAGLCGMAPGPCLHLSGTASQQAAVLNQVQWEHLPLWAWGSL